MNQQLAERAVEVAADVLNIELELYEGYSGRFMYGERTTGLVGPDPAAIGMAVGAALAFLHEEGDAIDPPRLRWDNLGRDFIVY